MDGRHEAGVTGCCVRLPREDVSQVMEASHWWMDLLVFPRFGITSAMFVFRTTSC